MAWLSGVCWALTRGESLGVFDPVCAPYRTTVSHSDCVTSYPVITQRKGYGDINTNFIFIALVTWLVI